MPSLVFVPRDGSDVFTAKKVFDPPVSTFTEVMGHFGVKSEKNTDGGWMMPMAGWVGWSAAVDGLEPFHVFLFVFGVCGKVTH